jgi:hypothetical protein
MNPVLPPLGETRKETVSQGGGVSVSLSGGDEHSEPESVHSSALNVDLHGRVERAASERGEAAPDAALPCQDSDNCIGNGIGQFQFAPLSPYRKKSRHRLEMAIEWMVEKHGIERVGLLTLSFGVPGSGRGSLETFLLREQAKDLEFVQGRWHSFCSNVVVKRYQDWICILEPHKDGVWHIHVVVATKEDIRTGTDVETLSNYKLPYWLRRGKHLRNEALAAEWKALRETACKYRFGRVELLPIKKTKEAFARYLGKYLTKTFNLIPPGRRHRLIRYSRGVGRHFSMRFSIYSLGNLLYRTRLKMTAGMLGFRDYSLFADCFGPRWNFYLRDIIASIPIPLRFGKGDFETGLAAKLLALYAEDPLPFLDSETKKNLAAAQRMLWLKFEELAFDAPAMAHWRETRPPEADNIDVGPLTEADLHDDLFRPAEVPF